MNPPIPIALLTLILLTLPAGGLPAQMQTFEQNVCITMGQRESQEEARVYALAECKRLVLEKASVYLEASTDIVQRVRESLYSPQLAEQPSNSPTARGGEQGGVNSAYQNDTELKKQILAVTAGVTQTEVVGEWWVVKGTHQPQTNRLSSKEHRIINQTNYFQI